MNTKKRSFDMERIRLKPADQKRLQVAYEKKLAGMTPEERTALFAEEVRRERDADIDAEIGDLLAPGMFDAGRSNPVLGKA